MNKERLKRKFENKVFKLIELSKKINEFNCINCSANLENCTLKRFEVIERIVDELTKYYSPELQLYSEKFIKKNPQPNITLLLADGVSMSPEIIQGDILLIDQFINFDIGDIICFLNYNPDGTSIFIIHRLIALDNQFVYAMGDNNNALEKVPKGLIYGKVVKIIKKEDKLYNSLYDSCFDYYGKKRKNGKK